jgi:hypothetical protein
MTLVLFLSADTMSVVSKKESMGKYCERTTIYFCMSCTSMPELPSIVSSISVRSP